MKGKIQMSLFEILEAVGRMGFVTRIYHGRMEIDKGGFNAYADAVYSRWIPGPRNEAELNTFFRANFATE